MKCKAGLTWDSSIPLQRYLEESCDVQCELVTPQVLAAPFFRGHAVTLIIPTGFGNPMYSGLLPALRASSDRIRKFVKNGGNLLVFGAMADNPNSYDWLPFPVTYVHEYFSTPFEPDRTKPFNSIMDEFDCTSIECDGFFTSHEGEVVAATEEGKTIMFFKKFGKGTIIIASIHEYPSRPFLKAFCSAESETLF